jgi:hypothetical protein
VDVFSLIAGLASVVGAILSGLAMFQASRASKAAKEAEKAAERAADEARKAALVRSLSDDLAISSRHAEELLDFLQQARYSEANLRANELAAVLSELPRRRSPYLSEDHQNTLINSRVQVQSIGDAIMRYNDRSEDPDRDQITKVARLIVTNLREVLGDVRSRIEQGGTQ